MVAAAGRPIRIVLLRHSKSCANHMRAVAGTHDPAHPLVAASQQVLDPALSEVGRTMAAAYGPVLRQRLQRIGFPTASALIASSGLRRAHTTAALLFPGRSVSVLPHIKEHGAIPENTPRRGRRCRPSWRLFLRNLATRCETDYVVVAHGSFLAAEVWPAVAGARHSRFANLDGFLVEGYLTPTGRLHVERLQEIPYGGHVDPTTTDDRCDRTIESTIHHLRSRSHRRRTQKRRDR
jgi:hypothetical protein